MSPPNHPLDDEQPSLDEDGTLYDPPGTSEDPSPADEDTVRLRISLSEQKANRLHAVAKQLGLPPSTLAERAIEMICNEVATIQEDSRSPDLLVEQYQASIDLLHAVGEGSPSTTSCPNGSTGSSSRGEEELSEA